MSKIKNSKLMDQVKQNFAKGIAVFDKIAIERGFEIWKKIEGYLNYSVSSKGNVRNIKFGKTLKLQLDANGYYIVRLSKNGKMKTFKIHRLVAKAFIDNPENKKCVDHINNSKIDNNVKNLRFATYKENNQNASISSSNTSGIKGVCWHKEKKKWQAQIVINGKNKHLGYFNTLEKAKSARQSKALQIFGEFTNSCEKI